MTIRRSSGRSSRIVDFWLGMGVDGLRLDAVPYLYEREGTNCENLPETHEFLQELRAHVDAKFPGADASGGSKSVAGRRRCVLRHRATNATWRFISRSCRECSWRCRWKIVSRSTTSWPRRRRSPKLPVGLFLRNHDELTLEMVTDEERDYMYRAYASDPRCANQSGHSPAAGATSRQQSPHDRADERAAVLAAGNAGHLLRRRNWNGGQYLSGRPRRRAHADAMESPTATPASPRPTRSSSFCRS